MDITLGRLRLRSASVVSIVTLAAALSSGPAFAEDATGLRADAHAALASLYKQAPSANTLGKEASAILVFPNVVKAGFIVGGQYGEGVLMRGGKSSGYYSTVQGSVGYQAGVEKYAYALFFMTKKAADYLAKSDGWELGAGPEVVIVDVGAAASLSTTTGKKDVYAFFFDQKGLMAGVSVQGTKITRIAK